MSEILNLLNNENAKRVAEDIILAIEEKGNKETLDFDFKMKAGVMERTPMMNEDAKKALTEIHECEVPSPNTWFSFDTKLDSMLGFLKDTICKKLEDESISDAEMAQVPVFLKKVINLVNKDKGLNDRLKNALRKVVLNNEDPIVFPLNDCKLLLFEFGLKEDYGDMIKVLNYQRVNKITGQFVGEKNGIARDLLLRRREFGFNRDQNTKEIYTKIIEDQRKAGNSLYAGILPEDVQVVSEAKECHLDIFADYAPLDRENLIAKVVETYSSVPGVASTKE